MNRSGDQMPPLSRLALPDRTRAVLNRGGWGNADVLLVEAEGGQVVVKDFAPRGRWVRRFLAPRLLAREEEAYRRLEGVPAVPRLLGRLDNEALVIEYRPGILLSRSLSGQLPADFLRELEETIDEMHRRGVVHLDLRHRSNILAGTDGHPIVIDFASALRFDSDTFWGRGLVALFGWVDRRALDKWRVRLVPV
jgi:tRNA A-37 threonylcarbamoyl transferase component Bud32